MDWWAIVKKKGKAFPKNNMSLIKEITEKIYMSIPADTVFEGDTYWQKFLDMSEASVPKEDNRNRLRFSLFKKNGKSWFRNFFLNYGRQRNYFEKISEQHPIRYKRTDTMQDYYKESLMKGKRRRFQFGKNLDNIMRDGKERTAKEAFLSLQDYYINKPDRSGGNIPTTAEVSGYLNSVAYKRYEKIKGRPNKYRWIGE